MNNQTTFIPDCQAQQAIKFCRYLIAKLDNSKLFLPKLLLCLLYSPPLRHQLKFPFSFPIFRNSHFLKFPSCSHFPRTSSPPPPCPSSFGLLEVAPWPAQPYAPQPNHKNSENARGMYLLKLHQRC